MTDFKRRRAGILLTLLLILVVVGLAGHFIVDISGHEPLRAFGLHAGLVLLPLIAIGSALTLVTTLLDDDPIHRWRFLPPHLHPPILLH